MTENDRQVITQIIKIIMQEHPGNSSHIMSDYIMSIYFKRCILISKFVMDINIYIVSNSMQNSFTRELIIQLKIILEKITQVGFDITLLIEICKRIHHIYIIGLIDLVNIIKKKHSRHLEKNIYITSEEHIRSSHSKAHNIKKVIIKFDIVLSILDTLGHFAQRGHQSPTVIKLNITVEYHIIDFSSIRGPNYLSIISAINLDIKVNAERFIRVIHLFYIYQFNIFDIIEAEQFAEHHLLDHISISKPNYTSVIDIKTEQNISDIFAEYHLLDYICISGPNYISVTSAINLNIMAKADRFIRTICPSSIKLYINQNIDIKTEGFIKTIRVEPCLPYHGNISCINCVFLTSGFSTDIIVKEEKFIRIILTSAINLLYDLDIDIKAERFIRTFCSSYINLIKSINRQAPSSHQQTLKSHRGVSSMNTSEEHIISVQDIMVEQEGLDIQTTCIYLTILSVFISKYFISKESITITTFTSSL